MTVTKKGLKTLSPFVYPETRTPKPRGQNTINDIFTKLRTLFNWAFDLELTRNRPFRHFKVKECVWPADLHHNR